MERQREEEGREVPENGVGGEEGRPSGPEEEDRGRGPEGAASASPPPADGEPPSSAPAEGEADGRGEEEEEAAASGPSRAEGGASEGEGRPESRGADAEAPGSPSPGALSRPETARADPADTFHLVKWIVWKGEQTPLITQSENGPCPLIALINILLLRWKVKLPPKTEIISVEQLMTLLGDSILSAKPREDKQGLQLNFEQNMGDAMSVLPKLSTGLDVNVRFTGVRDFEYTPECIIFDMLDIPLYHGWLIDPQSYETVQAVGRCSYNQLVEKIIGSKHSTDSALVSEGLVAEQFLDTTATQLTYHGLCELTSAATEDELCVFFRNNHFSTLTKHKGHLYLLVTDQGFLSEPKVVWESLHNVEGDGNFCDSEFCLSHPSGRITQAPQEQINQDYMVALSLQQQQGAVGISDVELARRLQEEEDHRTLQLLQDREGQRQATPTRPAVSPHRPMAAERRSHREEKMGKDCTIL